MWTVEELTGYTAGSRYIIRNRITDGYLSDNSKYGGAIHFLVRSDAETLVRFLNTAPNAR